MSKDTKRAQNRRCIVCLKLIVGLLVSALFSLSSVAETYRDAPFSVSGFGTVSAVYSSNEQLVYKRSLLTDVAENRVDWQADSRLGLQLKYAFNHQWEAWFQGTLQDRVSDRFIDYIDWAFLRYKLTPDSALRLGRLSQNLYKESESQNVGFAHIMAKPPNEFYNPVASTSQILGGDVTHRMRFYQGVLRTQFSFGEVDTRIGESISTLPLQFKDAASLSMSYQWRNTTLHIAGSQATVKIDNNSFNSQVAEQLSAVPELIWPGAAQLGDRLAEQSQRVEFLTLGVKYDGPAWFIQSELGRTHSNLELQEDFSNGYLLLAKRVGDLTFFTSYSQIKVDQPRARNPLAEVPDSTPSPAREQLQQLSRIVDLVYDALQLNQRTLSIGTRYELAADKALKLQVDRVLVEAPGSPLWGLSSDLSVDQDTFLISVGVDFVF